MCGLASGNFESASNALGGITWATLYGSAAFVLGKQFERYQTVIERFGVALAILVVVGTVAFYLFGKKRFERWALGEAAESSRPLHRNGGG